MPVYEYRCPNCGNEEEHIASIDNRHKAACTRCGITATLRASLSSFKMAIPLYLISGKGEVLNKRANSSSSDERNPDIPPDYPNLLEV